VILVTTAGKVGSAAALLRPAVMVTTTFRVRLVSHATSQERNQR
jgi:hypothetical protein